MRSGQRIPKRKITETKGKDDHKKIAGELHLLDHHGKVRSFVKQRQTRIPLPFHLPDPLPSESSLSSQQLFENLESFGGFMPPQSCVRFSSSATFRILFVKVA